MARQEFKVGQEVDSRCGKCKSVRSHVVIAMVDGKPKKVECLACRAVHNYRPPGAIKMPREMMDKATRQSKTRKVTQLSLNEEDAVNYSPKGRYETGMVLRHKSFGLGLITRAELRKLTVIFSDQTRHFVLTP